MKKRTLFILVYCCINQYLLPADDGACIQTIQNHGKVYSLAFNKDGTRLASSVHWDKSEIQIWDFVSDYKKSQIIETDYSTIKQVVFGPGSTQMVFSGSEGCIEVLDLARAGALLRKLNMPHDSIKSVILSCDERKLASSDLGGNIKVWDTQDDYKELYTAKYKRAPASLAFNFDGTRLALGDEQGSIYILDAVLVYEMVGGFKGHEGAVNGMTFNNNGTQLVSCGKDKMVKIWKARDYHYTLLETLRGHTQSVNSVAFSPDGMLLASSSDDRTIKVWYTLTNKLLHTCENHWYGVNTAIFNCDGMRMVSGDNMGAIKIWDVSKITSSLGINIKKAQKTKQIENQADQK